jgi:small multidrug resistance family-3 protein
LTISTDWEVGLTNNFPIVFLFVLTGLFEVGGEYLIRLWMREGKGIEYAALGPFVLYGAMPTLQTANFGMVYAA